MQNFLRPFMALVAFVLIFSNSNSAQADVNFNLRDDYYVLPDEWFYVPIVIQTDTQAENLVAIDYQCNYYSLLTQNYSNYVSADPSYGSWADTLGCCGDYNLNWAAFGGWLDSGNLNRQNLGGPSFFNHWGIGQEGDFSVYAYGWTLITDGEQFNMFNAHGSSTIHSIDGLRGDVNDDGIVDYDDVFLINAYFINNYPLSWMYNQTGINIGRGKTGLFSNNTLLDAFLINTWIYNNDDPLVVDLGIGQMMSATAYNSSAVQPMPYEISQVDNELTVNTNGVAVAVFGALPDGTPWHSASLTPNGEFTCQLPEGLQNILIEAVTWETSTSVSTPIEQPAIFSLKQNYPNPFNPTTTIDFSLANQAQVKLTVYNMAGQKVATLADGIMPAGSNSVNFDASQLASGVYFYTLIAGKQVETRKMTLMK